jgi:UDP-GlcNAc3NAcA epimerase
VKLLTIVGARPQFIKASAVSRAIQSFNQSIDTHIEEVLVHTGQHYDANMSAVFFADLGIPDPKYNLGVSQCSHGEMTGKMIIALEKVIEEERPNMVLVYGDTNSTLAGALAAVKLHTPVAHVESGLRSFNNKMPEEINRIVVDRISSLLFCPTRTAVVNLKNEGIVENVFNTGDVMYDATLHYLEYAKKTINLAKWEVNEGCYALCTIHRADNTDNIEKLTSIVDALEEISLASPIVFPVHPRTKALLQKSGLMPRLNNVIVSHPVSYFEMLRLESSAKVILTDSGGVQKEAFFNKVPCITLRDETEWLETVALGVNTVCGTNKEDIIFAWENIREFTSEDKPYGNGSSSREIVERLAEYVLKLH